MALTCTRPTLSWSPAPRPWAQSHNPDLAPSAQVQPLGDLDRLVGWSSMVVVASQLSFTFRDQSDRCADNLHSGFRIMGPHHGSRDDWSERSKERRRRGVEWRVQTREIATIWRSHGRPLLYRSYPAGVPRAGGGRVRRQDRDLLRRPPVDLQRVRRAGHPTGARATGFRHKARRPGRVHVPEHPEMLVANFGVPL